ncbi:16S rRNA methyltransferase [Ammoniphilus oxalaticus]|uniref:16S rRNA methyltransferase n=1 Tax=Ammoniphilus oxalaticus TaxID=66863 RepID=A0A419SG41_9BACL|nr:class I SAM-dependent methyltransferase [Ammoniphilus oxalaticus]RKD22749.1 16S rRNA methyltransferase [Ammoniphilus oxalaticus]
MTEHYYTNSPSVTHDEKRFDFQLRGREFTFKSDAGVFSKERIDFGSLLLIENMEIENEDRVLDVGCGYGPIGLTAAYLASKGDVLMVDINERAVSLANWNAKNNGIDNARAIESDLFEKVDQQQKFNVILTNPPIRAGKVTVHHIFERSYHYLKPGGHLWIVIQKKQGAPSAFRKLEETYEQVTKITQKKGYWIIKAQKAMGD